MSPKAQPVERKPKTLEQELDDLRDEWRGCDHEREIADEVVSQIEKVLERFGLLHVSTSDDTALIGCWYCGSKEYQLTHRHFCVEEQS